MNWMNNLSNKKVESIKYAINYELDNKEKKLLDLSIKHNYLIDWITEPFDKFGYSEELISVRKYYRMNYLQENDYLKISGIMDWNVKSLKIKNRIKYFLSSMFIAKNKNLIKSFIFYVLFLEILIIAFNTNLKISLNEIDKIILTFAYSLPIVFIASLVINLLIPIISFYTKSIFFDLYGNKKEQEKIKTTALNTIMKLSGVCKTIEPKQKEENNFLLNIELLSKKYENGTIKKEKNINPYINFCEDIYIKSNSIKKINYSYEELLNKNKEFIIINNKINLENLLSKEFNIENNNKLKI